MSEETHIPQQASLDEPTVEESADLKQAGKSGARRAEPLLAEVAWEVCNQLGGIYTVIRSKIPSVIQHWGSRYFLIGPYVHKNALVEFEPVPLTGPVGQVVRQMREIGIGAHLGRWLVTGRPHVVLLNYSDLYARLGEIKYRLWKDHEISLPGHHDLINPVVAFGEATRIFLQLLAAREAGRRRLIAHFHEWMAGVSIPMLRRENWPGSIVFTTHATILGRYLAMNDTNFYDNLPNYQPFDQARRFNIEPEYRIERAAAHGAHVFTTVSEVTGEECKHLLGRSPDVLLPNGLNIQRFTALHEFQNLHRRFKEKIHHFTMGHFFPSYSFDLDKTLYFFTSGRYEYRNKGMDLTIESLARLNHRLKVTNTQVTVVFFIITRRPTRSINVPTLQSHAMLDELRTVTDAITDQLKEPFFEAVAAGRIPDLNALIEEYWILRLRRNLQALRREQLPVVVTHDIIDDTKDEVLAQIRNCQLFNNQHDPVKIVYHPDFVTPTNPLFGMDYDQFVRGCHLGVFPSYYEPWGYTPLESIALGVPAITSDLSGFGTYLMQEMPGHEERGVGIVNRRTQGWHDAAEDLTNRMFRFCQLNRRERVTLRNQVESMSEHFDWSNLGRWYRQAYQKAIEGLGG